MGEGRVESNTLSAIKGKENKNQIIKRRDFSKDLGPLSAAAVLGPVLPKNPQTLDVHKQQPGVVGKPALPKLSEIAHHPGKTDKKKESEPHNGIQIIHNIGINTGDEVVDVEADPVLIKENIMERARQIISPKYFSQVETAVDRLIIGFGAKNYEEFFKEALDRQKAKGAAIGTSLNVFLTNLITKFTFLKEKPLGIVMKETKYPMIYINTGDISGEFKMREAWDHEITHFVALFDPDKNTSPLVSGFRLVAITIPINAVITMGLQLITDKIKANLPKIAENESQGKKNPTGIIDKYKKDYKWYLPGSAVLARQIDYFYLDKEEKAARDASKKFPTADEFFNKMIKVVPSGMK